VVSAAIGTLTGPLHGGANEEALETFQSIGSVANVKSFVENAVATKHKIMGLGHRVYKVKDPRATVLQELAENVFVDTGRPELYDIAVEVERLTSQLPAFGGKGVFPNVDFYSGIIYHALGIPSDLFTPIFAISRVAGWLSHWLEQLKNNRIYRPEQIYVGKLDVSYVPLEKRP
jgi:citrate synthase